MAVKPLAGGGDRFPATLIGGRRRPTSLFRERTHNLEPWQFVEGYQWPMEAAQIAAEDARQLIEPLRAAIGGPTRPG